MAIDVEKSPEEVTARTPATWKRRTWRAQLESPAEKDSSAYWCKGHREEAEYNAAGALLKTNPNCERPEIERTAGQIATQEFTAAGVTVTGAQLMALVSVAFDTFDEEDAAAAAPPQES